jgi:hypothetical protein
MPRAGDRIERMAHLLYLNDVVNGLPELLLRPRKLTENIQRTLHLTDVEANSARNSKPTRPAHSSRVVGTSERVAPERVHELVRQAARQ